MNFNLYNGLILAGSVQGLVFAASVLLQSKYRARSNYYLTAVILTFALDNLQYLLVDSGTASMKALVTGFYVPFALLTPPFFFQYGRLLLNHPAVGGRRQFALYLPFAVAFAGSLLFKVLGSQAYAYFVSYELFVELMALFYDLSVVVWLFLALKRGAATNDVPRAPRLRWFKRVLYILFAACISWFVVIIADYILDTELWYAIYLASSALIYWFGHIGIYEFGVAREREQLRQFSIQQPAAVIVPGTSQRIKAFEELMQHKKRYLDPQLSLEKVASELQMSKTHLSRLINNELDKGFSDYINALRVEEAKAYLAHPDFAQYTLAAIGLEAGFASKTTFNQAFKKIAGQTPSAYRAQMKTTTLAIEKTLI